MNKTSIVFFLLLMKSANSAKTYINIEAKRLYLIYTIFKSKLRQFCLSLVIES